MLLSVEPFDDAEEGTLLNLWFVGGGHKTVKPPCPPHYFAGVEQGQCELVVKRLLSNPRRNVGLYRVDFPTLALLDRYRLPDAIESHKRFVDVLTSEHGFSVPSELPKVLSWDVESYTFSRLAPDWRRDSIRSIAVHGAWHHAKPAAKVEWGKYVYDPKQREFGLCWSTSRGVTEEEVIRQFLDFTREYDPDVLAGFNDGFYDMRLLMNRCNSLRVPCRLGRDASTPYVMERMYERRGKEREVDLVRIRGRVHLDVFLEVMLDQTLFDLKGRGQVEVARHFGFTPMQADHGALTDANVEDVNMDDARCCYGLAMLYLSNIYALCDELNVPLNLMVERSPSHIPNWFYGQEFAKLGIVSDGYNCERYPDVFSRGGKPYQGAFVKCYKTGVFRNVIHIDFSSFYPSIMIEYNLSPETVSLIETKPWTGEYRFEDRGDYNLIEVPDMPKTGNGLQFVCRVEKQDGVTKTKLLTFREKREKLKAEYKRTKDEKLQSIQYALKVIQNCLYGYHGTGYALYGNILVAILITALARYHIQAKMREIEGQGFEVIEVDTDGFYVVAR